MGADGGYWHNSFSRSLMMALRASGVVRGAPSGAPTPLPRPNEHAPPQRGGIQPFLDVLPAPSAGERSPLGRTHADDVLSAPRRSLGAQRRSMHKPGWVAPRRGGDEASAATDLIIKHHASASLGASLFILYLSRYLISLIKQASKNKLQQLKNTALKALALQARGARLGRTRAGDNARLGRTRAGAQSRRDRARVPPPRGGGDPRAASGTAAMSQPTDPLAPTAPSEGGREAPIALVRPTAKRWHRPGSKILGIGFAFSGRVYGAQKAASFKMLLGSVPFNTLDARIDYANIMQQTRNGT